MFLTIHTVPPAEMRYVTVGDWQFREVPLNDTTEIRINVTVANTGSIYYNFLIGVHELVEAILTGQEYGFEESTSRLVDDFDMGWINDHKYDEPGDDPAAPYHDAHVTATLVERILAQALGVDWTLYENALDDVIKAMNDARATKPTD